MYICQWYRYIAIVDLFYFKRFLGFFFNTMKECWAIALHFIHACRGNLTGILQLENRSFPSLRPNLIAIWKFQTMLPLCFGYFGLFEFIWFPTLSNNNDICTFSSCSRINLVNTLYLLCDSDTSRNSPSPQITTGLSAISLTWIAFNVHLLIILILK